jgi:hypothetical protein
MVPYLSSIGLNCPKHFNPADFSEYNYLDDHKSNNITLVNRLGMRKKTLLSTVAINRFVLQWSRSVAESTGIFRKKCLRPSTTVNVWGGTKTIRRRGSQLCAELRSTTRSPNIITIFPVRDGLSSKYSSGGWRYNTKGIL